MSALEVVCYNKIPEPDILIPGDISVSEKGPLDLWYGDLASVVSSTNSDGEDVYHIVTQCLCSQWLIWY